MKKAFLFLVAFVFAMTGAKAQSSLVATLSQNGNVQQYYGTTALQEAYEAAADGAVITLSPGTFDATTIEKAITIRGAGMVPMESNGYVSTQITGVLNINVPSSNTYYTTIEGIHALGKVNITGTNLTPINLSKSRFNQEVICFGTSTSAFSCIFDALTASTGSQYTKNTTINCLNCVMCKVGAGYGSSYGGEVHVGKIIATNCIVNVASTLDYMIITNSIITTSYGNSALKETCSAQNCIGINFSGSTPNLFQNINNPSNMMVEGTGSSAFTPIFKTLTGLYTSIPALTETFELTETAAATYIGEDGTQVGIYGGSYPFSIVPSNPQIKKFTVINTTEDDKLKVKINVE